MQPQPLPFDPRALDAFVALAGSRRWTARIAEIEVRAAAGPRTGQSVRQRHGIELAIDRLREPLTRPPSVAELHAARLASNAVALHKRLSPAGRERLRNSLSTAMTGDGTLVPLFHLLRTAALQTARGFTVRHAGLEDAAPYDLVIRSGTQEAEIVCDTMSAEDGRPARRAAWCHAVDAIGPAIRDWLTRHPGRHLLKITLPRGLLDEPAATRLAAHVGAMLMKGRRSEHDDAVVLRLEPLTLPGATQPKQLWPALREAFGPEAHLAITTAPAGVFVMAARAGQPDEVATSMRQRLCELVPARVSGTRPAILAMFVDDTDRTEWRGLRDRLELESEARQFLANKAARSIIAVTCATRLELFGMRAPDAVADGDLRFRNPAHPAARAAALAPAVLSSV